MPIANCHLIADAYKSYRDNTIDLIELWSAHSAESAEHMTINFIRIDDQLGQRYAVMAWLYLPTLWPTVSVDRLQTGLASALAEGLQLKLEEVQVITMPVSSGHVVERGELVKW